MSTVGQPERATQNRVIALFREALAYRYPGDWSDRSGNSNIDEGLVSAFLTKGGYAPAQITIALHKLRAEVPEPRLRRDNSVGPTLTVRWSCRQGSYATRKRRGRSSRHPRSDDQMRVRMTPARRGSGATIAHGRLPPNSTAEQIMHMPAQPTDTRRWTEEEFYTARDAAPPGERWELVDGEVLVTPSPHWTHQDAIAMGSDSIPIALD